MASNMSLSSCRAWGWRVHMPSFTLSLCDLQISTSIIITFCTDRLLIGALVFRALPFITPFFSISFKRLHLSKHDHTSALSSPSLPCSPSLVNCPPIPKLIVHVHVVLLLAPHARLLLLLLSIRHRISYSNVIVPKVSDYRIPMVCGYNGPTDP